MNTGQHNESQLSPLGAVELEAMRLWFEGFNSQEIEKQLRVMFGEAGVIAGTIRHWFCKGGKLRKLYENYAEEEAKERRSQANDLSLAVTKEMLRILVTLARSSTNDSVRYAAAKELVNRTLGEPVKVVANLGKDPVDALLAKYGIVEKINDSDSESS